MNEQNYFLQRFDQVDGDWSRVFPDGRAPDIVHAWTPRENVRLFCEKLAGFCSFHLFIHLEDNEELILEVNLGSSFEKLARSRFLDVPVNLSHPRIIGVKHTSTDLFAWEKHGPLFPDFNTFEPHADDVPTPWSKAGGILDRQVDGRWLMYFGEGSIYHAWSDDLIHWEPGPQDQPSATAVARDQAATVGRFRSRMCMHEVKPLPSSPSRFATGTRTSSK